MSNIKEIILHAMQKDAIGVKSAVENELNLRISGAMDALRTDVSSELFGDDLEFNEDTDLDEDDLGESWGVFMKGGSIGDQNHSGKPAKIFANEIDAKEYASRLNKNLSPGEKKGYGIKYIVKAIKEDVDLDEEELEELSVDKVDAYRYASHKDKKPREKGRQLAFAKVTGRAKVNATSSKKDSK